MYSVGNALVMLLQNIDLIPSPSQWLASIILLHELFKTQDSQSFNPFSAVFAHLLVHFLFLNPYAIELFEFTYNLSFKIE